MPVSVLSPARIAADSGVAEAAPPPVRAPITEPNKPPSNPPEGAAQDPASLGGILSHLTSGAHDASYSDPNQANAASGIGGEVLGQIFGSSGIAAQVGQQASRVSGVDPQIIQQMMPVIASMLMGGLTHAMNGQGLGGILGQLANAATSPGGLASTTNSTAAPPASGGLLGGLFGSVIGALTGGGSAAAGS